MPTHFDVSAFERKLIKAREAAVEAAHLAPDDGGASNFDSPIVIFADLKPSLAELMFKRAGIDAFHTMEKVKPEGSARAKKMAVWRISPPVLSQGYRRTAQAEAMAKVLKGVDGVFVAVRYVMD